ncbi:MAG: hypothetical protein II755_02485, partial [Prevotella sp.]|nr:hypothetical protein [Prevotella sp.]
MRLRIHTLIMLMLCAVMTAWGETVTYTMTIDSKSEGGYNNVHWASSTTKSLVWNDITWNVDIKKNNINSGVSVNANYAHIGSTDYPATKITMSTTGFAGKIITKVSLRGYCMTNTGPKLTIKAGETTILDNIALTQEKSGTTGNDIPTYTSTNTENVVLDENDAITFTINNPTAKCGIAIYAVSVEYEEPVPASVTLNSSGFATYASTHPLDFSNTS